MEEIMSIFNMILEFVKGFKGMDLNAQITGIVLIVCAVWKSSAFKPYWDKLKAWKFIVPGALGLVLGLVEAPHLDWTIAWESLRSGLLAIALHKILVALKDIPGIGPKYIAFIDFMEKLLRKPAQAAKDKGVKDPVG